MGGHKWSANYWVWNKPIHQDWMPDQGLDDDKVDADRLELREQMQPPFWKADLDNSGSLSQTEFLALSNFADMKEHFMKLGLEAQDFWDYVDDSKKGEISFYDLLHGFTLLGGEGAQEEAHGSEEGRHQEI